MRISNILRVSKPNISVLAACLLLSLLAIAAVWDSILQSSRDLAALKGESRLQRLRSSLLICEQQTADMAFAGRSGTGELRAYAWKAMSENPAIRMMVSSPDGTEESRSPDDYAVLKNTAFLKARDRALESGQQEIAGPFLLADGSTAAAIISPAFTGDGSSTPRGYTASLVDFTVLQKDADFGAITRSGFRYSLYTGSGRGTILAGGDAPGSISAVEQVYSSIDIGGREWHLRIACPYSTQDQFITLGLLLLFIAGSVLASMLAGAAKRLAQVNCTDPLTGILNRRGFDGVLERLSRDRRLRKVFVVAVDLNNFKSFNDRYGHAAGDSLLRSFAGELEKLAGKSGRVSRNGGDEFQIFIRNPAESWLRKLEDFLSVSHFFFHAGARYWFKASGVAAVYPAMGTDFKQLYIKADAALYHSKANRGCGRLSVFTDDMTQEVREQMGFNFSDLAAGTPAGVLICRSERARKILYANSECLSLFGCATMNELMAVSGGTAAGLMENGGADDARQSTAGAEDGLGICRLRGGQGRILAGFSRKAEQEYLGGIIYMLLWREEEFLRIREGLPAAAPAAAGPEARKEAKQRRRRHPSARKGLQAGARVILQMPNHGAGAEGLGSGNRIRRSPCSPSGLAGFAQGAACILRSQ